MYPSFYTSSLSVQLLLAGTETSVTVSSLLTLTGETISFSNFTPFTKGYIVVDPESTVSAQPEIISFTGITANSNGTGTFTGVVRGLSSISNTTVSANKVFHGINSPVIISWGAQNINDVIQYLIAINNGTYSSATPTVAGIVKTTTSTSSGVVVSTDDIRVSDYTDDTGTANTYLISPSPAITSYVEGQYFSFKIKNSNTGASTLNVNSLGAKSMKKIVTTALAQGDLTAGQIVTAYYDGTNFQVINLSTNTLANQITTGTTTHDISTTTQTTITHGLSVIPKFVEIQGVVSSTAVVSMATATYSASTQNSIYMYGALGTATGSGTGNNAFDLFADAGSNFITGVITTDATNIYLNWTKTSSPTGTADIIWKAFS